MMFPAQIRTSHVLFRAWSLLRGRHASGGVAPINEEQEEDTNQVGRSSARAFIMCTAAFRQVMLPLICVSTDTTSLSFQEVNIFLHDAVRPFSIAFVFRLSAKYIPHKGSPTNSEIQTETISALRSIKACMPHLESLSVAPHNDPHVYLDEYPLFSNHFFSALPRTLRKLELVDEMADDGSTFSTRFMNCVAMAAIAEIPLLEELRCGINWIDGAFDMLFSASNSPLPQLRSLHLSAVDFPEAYINRMWRKVLESSIVRQLRELSVASSSSDGYFFHVDGSVRNVGDPSFATHAAPDDVDWVPDLSSLVKCEWLGDDFLSGTRLAAVPDFSVLERCVEFGGAFLSHVQFTTPNVTLDLSGMKHVHTIGSSFLRKAKGVSEVIFPTALRKIGSFFAWRSSLQRCDFEQLESLESLDVAAFLCECEQLTMINFDTAWMAGKIGSKTGAYFLEGSCIVKIDLSGLVAVTSLSHSFLANCPDLTEVHGTKALRSVTDIGSKFLRGTSSLSVFEFSHLESLLNLANPESVLGESPLQEKGLKTMNEIIERNKEKKRLLDEEKRGAVV